MNQVHGFDIYFAGKIIAGRNLAEVKANIGRLFKLSGNKVDTLFSGKPVRIKADINAEEAGKYRQIFLKAGGLISVVAAGSPPPVPEQRPVPLSQPEPAPAEAEEVMELLPANTGSLIDTAKPKAEFDLSHADQFGLSPAGALLPEGPAKPSFDWESISHTEVLPANTGSLEEFEMPKKPVAIPDISQLHTVDGGNLSDDAEQPVPVDIPSTDHLQASQPNTGTLEDCVEEKTPVKVPDTSNIKLVD